MDGVFEYKKQFIDSINSMPDDEQVIISIEQLFYLLVSDNPADDDNLLNTTKKILNVSRKGNEASCSIKNLKKIINYTNISGLNESINKEIYNLLVVDQLIKKNNEVLFTDFDQNLCSFNNRLIENYKIKKNIFLDNLLNN